MGRVIVVVIPSRGRPDRAREAVRAALDHAVLPDTRVVLAVDRDDPEHGRYTGDGAELVTLQAEETGNLVRATNTVSLRIAADSDAIIGNLGDDHMVRTPGWDAAVEDALRSPGIAYGDDLIHGEALPTAPFISAAIVRALGWYALPTCEHLFIDTVWKDIGTGIGRLHYLPGVVIEHVHPLVAKTAWDDGYRQANSQRTIDHDWAAYTAWRDGAMAADLERVRAAL